MKFVEDAQRKAPSSKAPKPTEAAKGIKRTKDQAPADGEKQKRQKVRKETRSSYIAKLFSAILVDGPYLITMLVLKQVHPDTGISNKVMVILNSFVNDIFERIATEASSKFLFLPFGNHSFNVFFFSLQSSLLTQKNPLSPPMKSRPPSDSFFLMNLPSMLSLRVQVGHKYVA
jgi:hypothetical protein